MKNICIFASGAGSNAKAIIDYFKDTPHVRVSLIITNNPAANVLRIAQQEKIVSAIVSNRFLHEQQTILKVLSEQKCDLIVLAGFMKQVPDYLVKEYKGRMINIHPSLLPKYGGKGMFGKRVHEAVLNAGESKTGITIHYVNEEYDKGEIILQKETDILPGESVDSVSGKVQALEHYWLPRVAENLLQTTLH